MQVKIKVWKIYLLSPNINYLLASTVLGNPEELVLGRGSVEIYVMSLLCKERKSCLGALAIIFALLLSKPARAIRLAGDMSSAGEAMRMGDLC